MHQRLVHVRVERLARSRRTLPGRACSTAASSDSATDLNPPVSSPCSRARPMSSSTGSSAVSTLASACSRTASPVPVDPLAVVGVLGLHAAAGRRCARPAAPASRGRSRPLGGRRRRRSPGAPGGLRARPAARPPGLPARRAPVSGSMRRLSRITGPSPLLGAVAWPVRVTRRDHSLSAGLLVDDHRRRRTSSSGLSSSTISASTTSSSGRRPPRGRGRDARRSAAWVCAYIAVPIFWLTWASLLRRVLDRLDVGALQRLLHLGDRGLDLGLMSSGSLSAFSARNFSVG